MKSIFKKKRLYVLLFIPVFLALVILSPILISSSTSLNLFLAAANRNMTGRLSIDSWMVGWQQGVLCKNVVYSDAANDIRFSVPVLTSTRGLMELLLAPKNLGIVHVDSPVLEFSGQAVQAYVTEQKAMKGTSSNSPPVWDKVYFEMFSKDGELKVKVNENQAAVHFKDINIDAKLAGGVVTFDVTSKSPQQGSAHATGSLNLPVHQQGWLETIIAETKFNFTSFQVADVLAPVADSSKFPKGAGILNADIELNAAGIGDLEFKGLAELTDVSLAGGLLGDDKPSVNKFHLFLEAGKWSRVGWNLKGLEISSDFLSLKGSGKSFAEKREFLVDGKFHLPALFEQFPFSLGANESTLLETGEVAFAVDTMLDPQGWTMKLKVRANSISGTGQEKEFAWDGPAYLQFHGENRDGNLEVKALQVDSSFARAKGSGDLHSFAMDASVDVERTLLDLGALFQTSLAGSGKMSLSLKNKPAEQTDGWFTSEADIAIEDFGLNYDGRVIVPSHNLSLIGTVRAPDSFVAEQHGKLNLQLVLSAWLGDVFLVMNGEKTPEGLFKGYFTSDSELDLAGVSSLFNMKGDKGRMGGKLQLQTGGFGGNGPLEFRDFSAEITDFSLDGNDAKVAEPRIKVKIVQSVNNDAPFLAVRDMQLVQTKDLLFNNGEGLNQVDFGKRNIALRNVHIETSAGISKINSLVIPDWQRPFENISSDISLAMDLAKISDGMRVFGDLPEGSFFKGQARLDVKSTGAAMTDPVLEVDTQVADFFLVRKNKIVVNPDSLTLQASISGTMPYGEMTVDNLKLSSNPLTVDASGKVIGQEGAQMLELEGRIATDLETLSMIVGNELGIDLRMQGKHSEQFNLRYPLWEPFRESFDKLGFASSLSVEKLLYKGVEFSDVILPVLFDNNVFQMDVSGHLNDGRVKFSADTDYASDPPVLKIADNSQVLQDVQLTDPLADVLLNRIHPLFSGLATSSGTAGLRLDSFWWPLGEQGKNEADFVAMIDVRNVQLKQKKALQSILAMVGLDEESLTLQDNEMYCFGKSGAIKCSPVHIMAGDSEFILSGKTYMDGQLEYTIQLPFTRKIVTKEIFQVLEGTTVDLAIQGTNEKPIFDHDSARSTIQNLKKQATEEIARKSGKVTESS